MTLDEAIKHCEEKAKEIRKANEEMPTDCKLSEDLCECANEHEQLAEWLKDYKRLLEISKDDLISRKFLKAKIPELDSHDDCFDIWLKRDGVEDLIDNAPTVAGIPQGKWIIDQEGDKNTITLVTCPFCGERHCCKMNFCGNCGADMRGKE